MLPGDFQFRRPTRADFARLGVLGFVSLIGLAVVGVILVYTVSAWLGLPVIFGAEEGPEQPIAFPHPTHVQQLGLDCTFCHRNVTQGATASIPSVGLCMTCHRTVGDGLEEVEKLRAISAAGQPINWVRVYRVPDHVQFTHEPHIRFFSQRDGVAPSAVCSTCHGNVAEMVRVHQARPLKMDDCVNCHRDNGAPTDCWTCHY